MTSTTASLPDFTADSISASGRTSDKLSLLALQSKMKCDPEGYTSELNLVYNQFKSSVELFLQQAALNFTSLSGISADSTVAKDLGERALFLAHVTLFYPNELAGFPNDLVRFLQSSARNLPSGLRGHVTQALILLINRKVIDIGATLVVFIELQTVGDKNLKELASTHVIKSIQRMNQKHKNDPKNRALQNILFTMLQQEDEAKAVRALKTLCKLHQKKVWFDDRTANAICTACFHPSSRIMQFSLKFLLEFEKIEYDDSDDSDSDDEPTPQAHIVLSREAIYKANHKGTTASKKKKKAKLERVARSMKKQQRKDSKETNSNYYSPLNHLKDAQGFVEKLFSRLQSSIERFDVKMIMIKVIARTIGLHHLILLSFYPYLQKYVQPHQTNVVELLAAAVQACHDMVPPDSIEPLFKQIVNQFVHDRSRPEAISVGLNVVREICLRMPLLMTEDLLQDLVLYRKSNEKAVSSAARSLLSLFREVCPSLLIKKDRGRSANTKSKPKAFGEVHVSSNIPGIELLEQDDGDSDEDEDEDVDEENDVASNEDDDGVDLIEEDGSGESDGASSDEDIENEVSDEDDSMFGADDVSDEESSGDDDEEEELEESSLMETDSNSKSNTKKRKFSEESSLTETDSNNKLKTKKSKFFDFEGQLNVASDSLRALKKLAGETLNVTSNTEDGILSNEDFQRLKDLKAKEDARNTLTKHGFKVPNSDQLSMKRVDAAKLKANIRNKLTKDERKALMKAGREDDDKYRSKTAVKQKKTGGSSNKQKEHKKIMPRAAKQSKINRGRVMKKKQSKHADKQFRGRKAWKN